MKSVTQLLPDKMTYPLTNEAVTEKSTNELVKRSGTDNLDIRKNDHSNEENKLNVTLQNKTKFNIDPTTFNEMTNGTEARTGVGPNDGSEIFETIQMKVPFRELDVPLTLNSPQTRANQVYSQDARDRSKHDPAIEDSLTRVVPKESESVQQNREVYADNRGSKVLGRFKVSRTSQSESVINKNDTEHSPETIQEELSQSDSCLDDDATLETPHQMGRFIVEKVNKQELANDVKSHTNGNGNISGLIQNSSQSNSLSNMNESPHHSIHYDPNSSVILHQDSSIVNTTTTANTNATVAINVRTTTAIISTAIGSSSGVSSNRDIGKEVTNGKKNNFSTKTMQQHDDETNNSTIAQSSLLSLASLSRSNSLNKHRESARPIAQWTKQDCVHWISSLGDAYIDYAAIFEKNAIDGGILEVLDDKMLQEIEITKNIHRMVILKARDKLLHQT